MMERNEIELLPTHVKINSRWIKYLNVKKKMIILSGDNIGKENTFMASD